MTILAVVRGMSVVRSKREREKRDSSRIVRGYSCPEHDMIFSRINHSQTIFRQKKKEDSQLCCSENRYEKPYNRATPSVLLNTKKTETRLFKSELFSSSSCQTSPSSCPCHHHHRLPWLLLMPPLLSQHLHCRTRQQQTGCCQI